MIFLRVPQARTTQRPTHATQKSTDQKNSFGGSRAARSGGDFGSMLRFAIRHPWLTILAVFSALDYRRVEHVSAVGMDDAVPYLGDGTSVAT